MTTDDVTLRELATEADYEACAELQRATWGDNFRELVGPALLKVTQQVGGVTGGAFDRHGELAGFVYGITGLRNGEPVHWSHMLAVRDSRRDSGLGRRLKLYQRARMREHGVTKMLWTFDPLVARNAHLNLNRLGTRVLEYVPDMYGTSMHSRTDSVIGSDRFVVEWNLAVEPPHHEAPRWPDAPVVTLAQDDFPRHQTVIVEIPEDVQRLKLAAPEEARKWRDLTRRALIHYASLGYRVTALGRGHAARTGYVLTARV